MNTGDKILQLMVERNVSRGELAKAIGVNYQALCKYLQNNRSIPDAVLVDIANYFNVTVDYLLNRNTTLSIDYNNEYVKIIKQLQELNEHDQEIIKNLIMSLSNKKDK